MGLISSIKTHVAPAGNTVERVSVENVGTSMPLSELQAKMNNLERCVRVDSLVPYVVQNWNNVAVLEGCVVSVASYGPRISTVSEMLISVGFQSRRPGKLVLNLPLSDFPRRHASLPADLLTVIEALNIDLIWVEDDLGPHNKYVHVMNAYPDYSVITLDDDNYYHPDTVSALWSAHKKFSTDIIAIRTHKMAYTEDGNLRPYVEWEYEQRQITDVPSYDLFATGVGGVLYPPHALPIEALDPSLIRDTCLRADDVWLKFWTAQQGAKVVQTGLPFFGDQISGSQAASLCGKNVQETGSNNDRFIDMVVTWFRKNGYILTWMNSDRC